MSLSVENLREQFNTNGSTTNFAFSDMTFLQAEDVKVSYLATGTSKETPLVLNTDYTVNATFDEIDTIGASSPFATGTLVISRNTEKSQEQSWATKGAFSSASVEDALDKQAIQVDEATEKLERTMQVQINDDQTLDLSLPLKANRVSKYLGFNADGEPVAVGFTSGEDIVSDTAVNFTSNNPTLLYGQLGVEVDALRMKVGDGSTAWTALPYITTVVERDAVNVITAVDITKTLPSTQLKNGSRVFYAWQGGDGSHEFKIALSGSWELQYNGIALDATALGRIGEGAGSIELEADVDNEVWNFVSYADADAGLFSGMWSKDMNGYGKTTSISFTTAITGGAVVTLPLALEYVTSGGSEVVITMRPAANPVVQYGAYALTDTLIYYYCNVASNTAVVTANGKWHNAA